METLIEIVVPVGYEPGHKVTDKIIDNLQRIYCDVVLTKYPTGKYGQCIILNSYRPHDTSILDIYPPEKTWYYMFDMNWGVEWYEQHKDRLQLISDKPYPGSRFLIPTGMMALAEVKTQTIGKRLGKICIMESYNPKRVKLYDKYLQSYSIDIDVIGTTMNNTYNHNCTKVDSVDYGELPTLLQNYSYCLILGDDMHNCNNLPVKVAECLECGVLPILDSVYGNSHPFPVVDSVVDIIRFIESINDNQVNLIYKCIKYYKGSIDFNQLRRSAQLIETDELYIRELEQLLQWGREKHRGYYWRDNLDVKDFIEALKRHLAAYESGEKIDPETGISHLVAIGANAMFKRRIDEQE